MGAPFVVGIAGGTASGKTTIVSAAAARMDATVLAHDRYYFDAPTPRGHDFDVPEALDTALMVAHLDALRRGEPTDVPVYDFSTHTRAPLSERVRPGALLFVEGILVLQSPDVRRRCDLTVYVHAPDDVRLARRIVRDIGERARTLESVLEQWFTTVRPAHLAWVAPCQLLADLVLDGEGTTSAAVEALDDAIRERRP